VSKTTKKTIVWLIVLMEGRNKNSIGSPWAAQKGSLKTMAATLIVLRW